MRRTAPRSAGLPALFPPALGSADDVVGPGFGPDAGTAYQIRDVDGKPLTVAQGRAIVAASYHVRSFRISYRGVLGGTDQPEQQLGTDLGGMGSVFEGGVVASSD